MEKHHFSNGNISFEYNIIDAGDYEIMDRNLFAKDVWDIGPKYKWGETAPSTDNSFNTYKYKGDQPDTVSKYCESSSEWGSTGSPDDLTVLQASDSPASLIGDGWKLPSTNEWGKITEYLYNEFGPLQIQYKDNIGYAIWGSLIFPLEEVQVDTERNHIWLENLAGDASGCPPCTAYINRIDVIRGTLNDCSIEYYERYLGCSIRLIRPKKKNKYLTFTSEGTSHLSTNLHGEYTYFELEVSRDTINWTSSHLFNEQPDEYEVTTSSPLYVRAVNSNDGNKSMTINTDNYGYFVMSGDPIWCFGDATSLLNHEADLDYIPEYAFCNLFQDCTILKSAPYIKCNSFRESSCSSMFCRCSSLTETPLLKIRLVRQYSLDNMFAECANLSHIKIMLISTEYSLPSAYSDMFYEVADNGVLEYINYHITRDDYQNNITHFSNLPSNWIIKNEFNGQSLQESWYPKLICEDYPLSQWRDMIVNNEGYEVISSMRELCLNYNEGEDDWDDLILHCNTSSDFEYFLRTHLFLNLINYSNVQQYYPYADHINIGGTEYVAYTELIDCGAPYDIPPVNLFLVPQSLTYNDFEEKSAAGYRCQDYNTKSGNRFSPFVGIITVDSPYIYVSKTHNNYGEHNDFWYGDKFLLFIDEY